MREYSPTSVYNIEYTPKIIVQENYKLRKAGQAGISGINVLGFLSLISYKINDLIKNINNKTLENIVGNI